ncbi:hypothetical protein BJV82DRAFT_663589 [Fennellomyces sp. T-0311]|nr:hypothetical protein BJV82DRAFT_663589 [Fennellomyces sp. T-0311]
METCTLCSKKFKSTKALEAHYNSSVHKGIDIPVTKEISQSKSRSWKKQRLSKDQGARSHQRDSTNDTECIQDDFEPDYGPDSGSNNTQESLQDRHVRHRMIKTSVVEFKQSKSKREVKPVGTMNKLEEMMARFAFDVGLSSHFYDSFVDVVSFALEADKDAFSISTATLTKLKSTLKHDAGEHSLLDFQTIDLNLDDIKDFPKGHEKELLIAVGGRLQFVYRDIHDLCQHLFGHPAFLDTMILNPSIYKRNGERCYIDLDSGTQWETLQQKHPDNVILNIMLASDQTTVTGNMRNNAWPLYLKLGNIPAEVRENAAYMASRVLAFFPTIEWQTSKTSPDWFTKAKYSIIHHCLSLVLKPFKSDDGSPVAYKMKDPSGVTRECIPALSCYIADLPEQRLLAAIKSGNTTYSCPRCTSKTCHFHLPYDFAFESNNCYGYHTESEDNSDDDQSTDRDNDDDDPSDDQDSRQVDNNDSGQTFDSDDDFTSGAGRTNRFMKRIYQKGRKFIKANKKTRTRAYETKKSFYVIKNAFWDVPYFSIYRALTVDDLHQLGGVYKHLLTCIEAMLVSNGDTQTLSQITKRAQMIPAFSGLRPFKSGYLFSALKNPTYTELKSHMSILMLCVHDLLPLQAVLCMRHFIDFYHQAVAKEHSDTSLREMENSLLLFNQHSAVFAQWSPSNLAFPKNHALFKYSHDIKRLGRIHGYSTTHSECQHKRDAKRPAQRTNHVRDAFTLQIGEHIMYRDMLYDQYEYKKGSTVHNGPCDNIYEASAQYPARKYVLSSLAKKSSHDGVTFIELEESRPYLKGLFRLTKSYLSLKLFGNKKQKFRDMPSPENLKLKAYQRLKVIDYDDDCDEFREYIHAHPKLHGQTRFDYAELQDGSIIQALLFFKISIRPQKVTKKRKGRTELDATKGDPIIEELCFVRVYENLDIEHASGFQVIKPVIDKNKDILKVISVNEIQRPVHVAPDFSTGLNGVEEKEGVYDHYLVNHDVNAIHWSFGATVQLPTIPVENHIIWE